MVILQCRGLDNPRLAPAKRLSPQTCWTSTRQQRSQSVSSSAAVWRHDLYGTEQDRAQKGGMTPYPEPESCDDVDFLSTRITPFVAADGEVFASCTAQSMPPEAAVGAAYPPSEVAAFTNLDGTGEVQFEVRTATENESLGCSDKVACSLVVIPIMGISCLDADRECNRFGRFPPGSSNFANEGVDAAVSPVYWWSPSNWRNRFTVPLSFGLPPDACDVLDTRPPTGFYGSELLSQAALQWAPAYCLSEERFKFQHNRMSDEAAFALMESGQGSAALVSGKRASEGADPVGYAPTAVTGFAVSYVLDKPDNRGEQTRLRLTPRLLAKLLTQSYPASTLGLQHAGMAKNPLSLNLDPEFQRLNPGLDTRAREAAATVLSLSESSDVIRTLTEYVASDKDARAFIAGKPDPWGMVVNPTYKGVEVPRAEWPLLDRFVPTTDQECLRQNPAPYFTQVAAPVSSLRKIAEAVLDAWPNVQTRCEKPSPADPYKLGRVERQGVGARFMLGIVSLGDAARFGLRTAELQTKPGVYVAPSARSLAAAIAEAEPGRGLDPFTIDQGALRKAADAYPGTMVVYTAARLSGMQKSEASKVAQFIRLATTEGQVPGAGNGRLPEGYLPITKEGPTAPLLAAAQRTAAAVAAQQGAGVHDGRPQPPGGQRAHASGPGDGAPPADAPLGAPGGRVVPEAPKGAAAPDAAEGATSTRPLTGQDITVATAPQDSRMAAAAIPLIVFIGLLAGLSSLLVRLVARRRVVR